MPMMEMFDRGITHADGPVPRQALDRRHHAAGPGRRRPARHRDLATHLLPLEEAPHGYEIFQKKEDGCVKVRAPAVSARAHAAGHAVVLVIGASSGIGRATRPAAGPQPAPASSSPRARRRPWRDGQATACGRGAPRVLVRPDRRLRRRRRGRAVRRGASTRFGRVDAVVHSAAVVAYGRLEDVPGEVYDHALEVNLLGTVRRRARHGAAAVPRTGRWPTVLVGSLLGQDRHAVHELLRRREVGRPRPRPARCGSRPRRARRPRQPRLTRRRQHPGLRPGRQLHRPRRAAAAAGGPAGEGGPRRRRARSSDRAGRPPSGWPTR